MFLHLACFVPVVAIWQDASGDMSNWPLARWNPRSELPLSRYLVPTLSEECRQRLHVLGNIVVPPQAAMAAALLTHIANGL